MILGRKIFWEGMKKALAFKAKMNPQKMGSKV